jgi:hypothetical protein
MQKPALTPQQEAIREVRARYERGDIPFERFEYALNALLAAQSPDECRAIVQELPTSPVAVLDGLNPLPATPAITKPKLPKRSWLVSIIGEFSRIKRPWRMGQHTTAVLGIGEIELDISLASMPAQSVLDVFALIGEATLYVPSSIHVKVRSFALIGEINAFGESRAGIFTSLNEEEYPARGAGAENAPYLEINAFMLIGEVNIKQVDAPVVTLTEGKDQAAPSALPTP